MECLGRGVVEEKVVLVCYQSLVPYVDLRTSEHVRIRGYSDMQEVQISKTIALFFNPTDL